MFDKRYYFDLGATPISDVALKAMAPYQQELFGNPESLHAAGQGAKVVLEKARAQIANLMGSKSEEIIFTSGATESDNLALKGVAYQHWVDTKGKLTKPHILVSPVEHPAVRLAATSLADFGFEVEWLPADCDGLIDPKILAQKIKPQTLLVSIIAGSNQFGTIQDLAKLGQMCSDNNVLFHTDASVFFGLYPLDVMKMKLDLATLSAPKIYGPKGVSGLYVRTGIKLYPLFHGGGQENGLRAGTHNLPAIVGFATAARDSWDHREQRLAHDQQLSRRFIGQVTKYIPHVIINGSKKRRLASNVHLSILGAEGESLVLRLASHGIAVSSGSACSSRSLQADPALKALGLTPEAVHGSLRICWHYWHTPADVDYLVDKLKLEVAKLRKISAYKVG